jgi:hypothetical protein
MAIRGEEQFFTGVRLLGLHRAGLPERDPPPPDCRRHAAPPPELGRSCCMTLESENKNSDFSMLRLVAGHFESRNLAEQPSRRTHVSVVQCAHVLVLVPLPYKKGSAQ